jgi:N-acetylneuraminate synthase
MIHWIAEISSNHNSSIERTYKLIDTAKEIGADAVKFQLFDENLYAPQCIKQRKQLRKWRLPVGFIPDIAEYCKQIDIQLGCTPFYLDAVGILKPYVDWYKIGSHELLWLDLIEAVARTGKPMILSTGMGTGEELDDALEAIVEGNPECDLTLLHCSSNYPALPDSCDLAKIAYYKDEFVPPIGWSDHTRHPGVIYAAIAHGAEVIEFHMDLEDGKGWESEYGHCWLPHEIQEVIDNVRIGEIASQPVTENTLTALRQQRTDTDGMRPLKQYRKE